MQPHPPSIFILPTERFFLIPLLPGSSSLLLIKENQENPSSAVLALRASVVAHGFVPVNKFPHKS